jgi:hypothetical protein
LFLLYFSLVLTNNLDLNKKWNHALAPPPQVRILPDDKNGFSDLALVFISVSAGRPGKIAEQQPVMI